ncbi:MAG: MOSC domain-containing protein [Pseudorhodoplanes sp.]|uniref:MOSC domain-containing protein n=1 Tax=Pseudorhodoplanes sp. TaxID=1934341 RepID=UPI003D12B8DE
MSWRGELLHIHVAPAASYEMEECDFATLVAGRGIEGDRYYLGTGTYSDLPAMREITLIEMEVLDALARNDPPLQEGPIRLDPAEHRRNLTVRGVPLGHLVGTRFRIGEAILRGARINFPCKYLEQLLGQPVYQPLYNRGGLNCAIETGGVIRTGDAIAPL